MSGHIISWEETRSRLDADRDRLRECARLLAGGEPLALWCHPSYVCVWLYRISHLCHCRGQKWRSRLFWQLNVWITGADISAISDLGPGLVIVSPAGTAITGRAGRNLTVMPLAGLGGELGRLKDVGAGPGFPWLGDDVILEPNCGVLGPVRVGHRVRVGATSAVTRDVPDDTIVEGPQPKWIKRWDLYE